METWTVFKVKKKDPDTKQWVAELFFMMGGVKEFEKFDFETDWRFCPVKDKREKAALLGDVDLEPADWPIKFPLVLKNGLVLGEKIEKQPKVAEQDDWIKKIGFVK